MHDKLIENVSHSQVWLKNIVQSEITKSEEEIEQTLSSFSKTKKILLICHLREWRIGPICSVAKENCSIKLKNLEYLFISGYFIRHDSLCNVGKLENIFLRCSPKNGFLIIKRTSVVHENIDSAKEVKSYSDREEFWTLGDHKHRTHRPPSVSQQQAAPGQTE